MALFWLLLGLSWSLARAEPPHRCLSLSGNAIWQCFLDEKNGKMTNNDAKIEIREVEVPLPDSNAACVDLHEECAAWAAKKECASNTKYMFYHCRKSCFDCDRRQGDKEHSSYGVPQSIDGQNLPAMDELFQQVHDYMVNTVYVDPSYANVKHECRNRHESCTFWATLGECEANPKYMRTTCGPACRTCDLLDFDRRCPRNESAVDVWGPGDLNRFFDGLVDTYTSTGTLTVYSSPTGVQDSQQGPWVVTLDDFLTPEECERLIELGHIRGYERSMDVGAQKYDGTFEAFTNSGRTSTNAWCVEDCFADPIARQVVDKIEAMSKVPQQNSEYLQLLRYEVTQRYQRHHDYIQFHQDRSEGARILTVFLYLNDVEAGGGTGFPGLNLTVMPKQGRVLIWPSVKDENPSAKDARTDHEALAVEAGIKYGGRSRRIVLLSSTN